jgi:hypothetical protein
VPRVQSQKSFTFYFLVSNCEIWAKKVAKMVKLAAYSSKLRNFIPRGSMTFEGEAKEAVEAFGAIVGSLHSKDRELSDLESIK